MASPQLQTIIRMLRERPTRGSNFAEARATFEQIAGIYPVSADVKREKADADGVPGEWITPPGGAGATTLFYIHGGAWTVGSVNTHARLVANLCAAMGARAFAIDYRLAPENPFPAGLDDCVTAYRWLLGQGVDPARLVIAGDSAGGNLTLSTLLRLRDEGDLLPAAAVTLSPATDLTMGSESMTTRKAADPMLNPDGTPIVREAYLAGHDPKDPLVSPLFGDLAGLPPLLMQVGDAEILLDDSKRFAQRAEEAGVDVTLEVWDEMIHVFQFFAPMLPEANAAIEVIGDFVKAHVGAPAAAS